MTRFEKINTVLGLLGFISGAIAIIVSILSIRRSDEIVQRQMNLESELRQSKVVLQIGCDMYQDSITFVALEHDTAYSAVYKQKYNVLINNVGFIDASITSWDVKLGVNPTPSKKEGYEWFQGTDISFFYPENNIPVDLPITIAPNQPKKIKLEVGVKVPKAAWNSVTETLVFNKTYSYKEAEEIFLKVGHPFFGQLDPVTENSYGDKGRLQQYFFTLTKGDGKRLSARFFHNINEFLIQGETQVAF